MSSRLIFLQGIQLASRLCHQRTPYFRASVLRRSVSDMKSTASPTVQAKPEINKLDGPDTVKGSIYELEKDIAIASGITNVTGENAIQFQNYSKSRFNWMFAFGAGTVILVFCGTFLQVYNFDVAHKKRMQVYAPDMVNDLESVVRSKVEGLEKVNTLKIKDLRNKLDTCLDIKKK